MKKKLIVNEHEDLEYKLSNRDKTKEPKKGLFWCYGCDCELVAQWAKCPYCGVRNGNNCLKKPTPKQ